MGTHPIFESDFDCLTEVIGEPNTAKMSEQIPVEFEEEVEEIDPFDMICGDDISRLPDVVNPNEKKPETIEEEKPSYAAVARSRPTSECNDNELVEDPGVEDVVEEPVQAAAPSVSATPKVEAAQPEAETEGKQSRAERKTKKAMMKLASPQSKESIVLFFVKIKLFFSLFQTQKSSERETLGSSLEKHVLKIQIKEQEKWQLLKSLKISNQKPRLNQFKQQLPKKMKKLMFQLMVLKKKTLSWSCNKLLALAPKPFPPSNRTPMISLTLSWSSPFDSGQMTHTDDKSVMTHVLGRLPIYLCMLF